MNSLFKLVIMLLLIGMMVIGFGSGSPTAQTIQASNAPDTVANEYNPMVEKLPEGANLYDPDVLIVTNTSGRYLPVIYGNTGAPVFLGNQPWLIAPGEMFYSYSWSPQHYLYWAGMRFHYFGSVGTSDNWHFFLIPDWTY